MKLQLLEQAADELTAATLKVQTLLTDYGLECENAELDGIEAPAMNANDKQLVAGIKSSTLGALQLLSQLEGN